jgi:hypothetical protein
MIDALILSSFEEKHQRSKKSCGILPFLWNSSRSRTWCPAGKREDDDVSEADCKTEPSMVADFVEQTGCDLLAVSVGNVHGLEIEPKVDLPLLRKFPKCLQFL